MQRRAFLVFDAGIILFQRSTTPKIGNDAIVYQENMWGQSGTITDTNIKLRFISC